MQFNMSPLLTLPLDFLFLFLITTKAMLWINGQRTSGFEYGLPPVFYLQRVVFKVPASPDVPVT